MTSLREKINGRKVMSVTAQEATYRNDPKPPFSVVSIVLTFESGPSLQVPALNLMSARNYARNIRDKFMAVGEGE